MVQFDLPYKVQDKIDELVSKIPLKAGISSASDLMKTYAGFAGALSSLKGENLHLAYIGFRMPATYASCKAVLAQLSKTSNFMPKSVLDVGAGPATGAISVFETFPSIQKAVLLERDALFEKIGRELLDIHLTEYAQSPEIVWQRQDLLQNPHIQTHGPFDLTIGSYSLGEVGASNFAEVLSSMWLSTAQFLVIIEPGTPKGYETIMKARDFLIEQGAFVVAPCPHNLPCPVRGDDWCHFSVRLARSKLHRKIKQGALGHEDEKYSYIIASKEDLANEKGARIIREPIRRSGHVHVTLCLPKTSSVEKVVYSRKHKEIYTEVKDLEWGDSIKESILIDKGSK